MTQSRKNTSTRDKTENNNRTKKNNSYRKSGHDLTKEPNAEQPATTRQQDKHIRPSREEKQQRQTLEEHKATDNRAIRQQDATDKSPHRRTDCKNTRQQKRKQQKPRHIRRQQTQRRKNRHASNHITIATTPHTANQTTKRSIVTPTRSTTNKTR